MAPSWSRSPGRNTADWYREFGRGTHGISASYETLCFEVAGDADVLARLESLSEPKRQPNLLLAAVRYLGGPVDSWAAFRSFVLDRWGDVAATMRVRRTQTNEARRCTALLPVLVGLPQPLALLEVGASAGLCLYPERWSYRYETEVGAHYVGSGPQLRCRVTGPVPLPERLPEITWRAGIDLAPVDVSDDEDVRWLRALIWPEEIERFDILREAVTIARADPPRIEAGDFTAGLATLAAEAPSGATLVVFHSAALAYVDEPARAAFASAVDALVRTAGCWLANEAPGVVPGSEGLHDDRHRFVLSRDRQPVAYAGSHGETLEWLP